MAYFRCTTGGSGKGNTLVVTCADDLARATITCTDGTKTYRKTCPSTAPYEVTFYGLEAGTWTVSTTVSGNTYTTTVVITDYEAELGGFNWNTWVDLSQNYNSSDFTDLDDLLSDETAVRELMTIHDCVDYLAGIAAESADVETIIGNDLCAKWINLRDYALDTLYANEIIADYMDEADKYGYGEWALMPQVPTMTSNTAPYGEAFASSIHSSQYPYYSFDGNDSTYWIPTSNATDNYVGYKFTNPTNVKKLKLKIKFDVVTSVPSRTFTLQGSNDGVTYTNLGTFDVSYSTSRIVDIEMSVNNDEYYLYYRIFCADVIHIGGQWALEPLTIQFYAWAPKGNVPVMTSNTAPYGEVTRNGVGDTGIEAFGAFDGNESTRWVYQNGTGDYIRYRFVNPICIKRLYIRNYCAGTQASTQTLRVSNDGINWISLADILINKNGVTVDVDNNNYYLYAEINLSNYVRSDSTIGIYTLQFYGRELKVSVPTMTSNNAPYGEAIGTNQYSSDYTYYKAFNGSNSSYCNLTSVGSYCGYDFITPKVIKRIKYRSSSDASLKNQSFLIKGSNDKIDWTDLSDTLSTSEVSKDYYYDINPNDSEFRYYAVFVVSGLVSNQFVICEVQFYGLDYSEKEFETGATKKWLYDHGVELETIEDVLVNNGSGTVVISHEPSQLYFKKNGDSSSVGICTISNVDITGYSLLRGKLGDKIYSNVTNSYGAFDVNTSPHVSAYTTTTALSRKALTNSDILYPNNIFLDVSSINQSAYIGVYVGSGSNSNTENSIKELWLE